jgi:putative ABC transport system permease protein
VKSSSELWVALREDAHFAYKSLARVPSYTATVVLTLALAIGGLTAVFSVLYAVVLRPLPFPRSGDIVAVHGHFDVFGMLRNPCSPNEFLDIQSKNHAFSKVAAYTSASMNMTGRGEAARVAAAFASVELIRLLGVPPALGRDFAPGEDQSGAAPVAILTSSFHRRAFAGAADVVGQVIELDGKPHTIIGVLPPIYDNHPRLGDQTGEDTEARDVWVPLTFTPRQLDPRNRGGRYIKVFGRLAPAQTIDGAAADMKRLADSFYTDFPDAYKRESGFTMWVEPLKSYGSGKTGLVLSLLLGAVALVLLAACANVVSITLARLASRRREIAVRASLGASARRIAMQFLVESVIVAVGAGILGVVIGRAGMDGLLAASADNSLRNLDVSFQLPVLAFALSVSILTGIVAGSVPAWHAARLSPTEGLREGGRATSGSAIRLRSALVVAQVTVALVLLVGTGMVLRSIVNLTATSPGFEPSGVYVAQVALAEPRYTNEPDARRFAQNALERVGAIPGVESVGLSNLLPLSGWSDWSFKIEGDPPLPVSPDAQMRMVAGDYFQTLGIRLVAGRYIGPGDTHEAPDVAVISELTVKKYFRGRNPLGMRIVFRASGISGTPRTFTIVGIVADTREMGIDEPVQAFVYVPYDQFPQTYTGFVVRAPKLGVAVLPAVRAAITSVDPTQPVYGIQPLRAMVDQSLGSRRFTLLLLSVFAALGLALAVVGIYGITSYSVVQRTQELAVRMAMGADDVAIVRLVLSQALRLVGLGLFFGAVLAALLGRYLASLIYGLSPWDPQAVGLIAATMVLAALVAGWVPARRAAALPLANALRTE